MNRPRRRFTHRGRKGPLILARNHPAMVEDRPLFPNMVRPASSVDWVLKSGRNSKKLGSHFSKGEWIGLPIYSLSLPERSTCPMTCQVRDRCYGNRMQVAPRFQVNSELMAKLTVEIENLASIFKDGFAVRLHALGDFPSVEYAQFWIDAVRAVPELHVFGFTAHTRVSKVGRLIERESQRWDRFRVRFSAGRGQRSATVADDPPWGRHNAGITCPADAEHKNICCGSCGFCMTSRDQVVFKLH
jgi:hypothetical protein